MIEWLTYSAKSIKGFPMGDPHERNFPVYLPPGYSMLRPDPYPVIFMLAGFGSRSAKFVWEESAYSPSLPLLLDRAIQNNEMPAAIIVFPDGTSRLGCSQYVNSPATGNYMDYIADELVNFIDQKYHTYKQADYRGIAGHSSGGFGALVMGMLRPDVFKNICSSAPDSFYEANFLPGLNVALPEIIQSGSVADYIEWFLAQPNPGALPSNKFHAMLILAMAPCYAPNLKNAPLFGELFFDLKTGAIIDEIWQKYLAWDPVRMVDHYHSALRSLKWLHLTAGTHDEFALQWGQRQIAAKLTGYGVPHFHDEYPGKHTGDNWRFVERLQKMLQAMLK